MFKVDFLHSIISPLAVLDLHEILFIHLMLLLHDICIALIGLSDVILIKRNFVIRPARIWW